MSSTTINRRLPRANGFWKLYLLMCKNTSVLLAHPLSTAIILIAPILLFLYTQVDQLANPKKPIERTETRYPHIEIGHPNISSIMYSPTNNVLRPVMEDMAQNLGANLTEAFLYASEMESALKSRDGFVGIEFDDKLRTIIEMPLKVTVSIRFPLHFRTRANSVWTNRLYKVLTKRSDKSVYDKEGFLIVQSKLSEAIIRSRNQSAYIPQVLMQPFPDRQRTDYSYLDPLFHKFLTHFTFIFMAPSLIIGQLIVTEKQRHLRELMRAMGLSIGMNWLSWFIISYLVMAIPMLILVCLMKVFLCPSTPFFVLLFIYMIYILTLICFTFMICTFVRSTTMVLTTLTLIQILSVLPFLITTNEMTTTKSVIVALFMNSAMASIWVQVCGFEIRGLGAQWKLLFHYSHPDDKISIGSILLIMLATNLVRLLFCFYADQLNLGEFGVAKKWYFPCKRKFWCPWERPRVQRLRRTRYESMDEERGRISNRNVNTTAYEVVLNQNPVVIEAQNLKKTYGGNDAVRDFSLKFYKDEITAMIGPNGSGKTTLFMMLAGLCRPSSGRVLINGHDLTLVPQMARHSFSVCPQHDVLFEELTAYWHIVFFSRLKGFQRTEAESEAQRYLEILNLMDKSTVSVKQLSVGMRRKLSICCALCANTKVLVCDEPTSCLDPLARYEVWSLLRKEKAGRCIVMTTHIMEAATFVGDRIAILCEGQLYSYGSPDFIVNNLGLGYRLVCSALDNCNVSEVTKYLMNRIPNVELEKIVGSEIHYRLPVKDVDKFTTLFKSLESKLDALKLTSFDVSAPTLSETFIKIGNDKKNRERTSSGNEEIYNAWATEPIDKKEHNLFRRRRNDWHGMMIKKILFTRNHLFQFILIVILPLLAILLNLLIDLIAKKAQRVFINPLDLSVYPRSMVIHEFLAEHNDDDGNHIFTDHSADVSEAYEMVAMEAGATVRMAPDGLGLDEFLLKNIDLFKEGFQETYVAGVTFRDGSVTAWFNRRLEHGAPLSLGLVYKAIAFVLVKMDIDIINHPRPDSDKSEHEHANILSTIKQTTFLLLYLCFAISAFVMLPVQERVMHMKEQHLISGVRLSTYWLSHLLCDFIIFLLILVVMLLALYKQNSQEIIWFMVVVLVFGLSALTFTYLLSFLFKDPGSAMLYMLVINCSVVMMGISMSTKHEDKVYKYFHHIFLILPFYAMYSAFIEIFRLSHQKSSCAHVNNQQNSCDQLAVHISKELIYLIVSGIIFFILLLLTSKWRLLRYAIKRQVRKCAVNNEDAFVRYARQQVDKIVKDENQLKECSLVCDRATRKKQNFLLVNCVSLKILPSECFAIIGLNNAGKSSFVKMVVGDHMISQGDIYVKGFSVKTQLNKCHEHMSYCEQNSNLWKYMTGRQMLRVVGLTSGIKKEFIPKIISYLAQAFTLTKDLDKKYKYYSSGTQKKLNIALAMLGRTLICLDEPTTGVDIGAKAEIWLALKQLLDLGRSILITSHNMAECQTLSTSVGVMVNGALTCYGSVEDLLDRYSKGITIKIQIATESEIAEINSKVSDSESKYSTNSSISFQERKLSKHQSVDIESDTERPSSSHRLSEDQDPNTKWTQVKKKDLKPIAPKMPSQVLTQMSSTRTTSIQERRVTTSTPRTISRRTTGLTYSMTIESQSYINSPEQYELIKRVERQFKHDFPGSFVAEKLTLSGLVTIVIPDNDLKWSTVFKYMEQQRVPLQIKHYSINYTTLQDIFLEFARDENAD